MQGLEIKNLHPTGSIFYLQPLHGVARSVLPHHCLFPLPLNSRGSLPATMVLAELKVFQKAF
jgi:hypothetical protein